jgi:hypothetical protein
MTSKEPKEPGEVDPRGRKPRGMGGVVLILALLMALFLVVSKSGMDSQSSVHAFYSHLLNGRVSSLTLSDGTVTAVVHDGDSVRQIEVVVREFLRNEGLDEINLYSTLASQHLDLQSYPAGQDATRLFLDDLQKEKIHPLRAFLVDEVASKSPVTRRNNAPKVAT